MSGIPIFRSRAIDPESTKMLHRHSSAFRSSPMSIHQLSRYFTTSQRSLSRSKDDIIPNSTIKVFRTISAVRQWRRKQILDYRSVGLVPTMGALHSGHLSLIRAAARENSSVVISIYVNPTQFGVHEDLDSYPKTWDADVQMLRELDRELAEDGGNLGKIAAVFAPSTQEMYPSGRPSQEVHGKGSFVTITPVGEVLEGASRPTFFRGVATVCMKLFNIVTPEKAYFGQKDVQQTVVIRKMVKDFCLDTEIVIGDTQRERDGLALSSRNVYLGTRRRAAATVLYQSLKAAEKEILQGERSRVKILAAGMKQGMTILDADQHKAPEDRVGFEFDYLSLADPDTMQEIETIDESRGAILSGAVKMLPVESPQDGEDLGLAGGPAVRLIDNIIIKPIQS